MSATTSWLRRAHPTYKGGSGGGGGSQGPAGVDLSWRGIGPLSVGSMDSTQVDFTQSPGKCLVRPVSGHLDNLFTSAAQTAIDTTTVGSEGAVLWNSIKDAHNNGYRLTVRYRGGERWPEWTATDATHPVNVWVSQNGKGTNATPQDTTDVPLWYNAGASPTDIPGAVAASNAKYWHDKWMQQVADLYNKPCPIDGTHTVAAHIHFQPVTGPSTFSPEMQIASSISNSALYSAVTGNSGSITGTANVKALFEAAWKQSLDVMMTKMPASIPVCVEGASLGWDGTTPSACSEFIVADYALAQGYGNRFVAHRTDWRYDYQTTFGGGASSAKSPWSWFVHCYTQGQSIAIQTAADGASSGGTTGGVLEGATVNNDTDRVNAYVQTIEMLAQIAPLANWLSIETSTSMTTYPATTGGTWTTGFQAVVPATGGFPGGTVCISQYLFSATGNVQSRL